MHHAHAHIRHTERRREGTPRWRDTLAVTLSGKANQRLTLLSAPMRAAGDISYAAGKSHHIWNYFMDSIEPFASHVPYMVAVGECSCK